ncbi:alpha/beta hydrolase [Actinomadura fulvescens]|uniref:Alpha/beta hydrolase n=1 Tax=Actinomadura fulvescens TaxID=46160 RepID=A0ABP6C386_9ACTN
MPLPTDLIPPQAVNLAVRAVYALPAPVRRLIAGRQVSRDGQRLAPEAQLLLALMKLENTGLRDERVDLARRRLERGQRLIQGRPVGAGSTRALTVPNGDHPIPARLYTPAGLPSGSPLLVYYHGGGFVLGSIDSHDSLCRELAVTAAVRVLSVGYRLAPEHPFPAAADDALAAYEYAVKNAESFGADPGAVAVGGDSAGGNLAAVVGRTAEPAPAFALLFYPATDLSGHRRSRELFAEGFYLTDPDMTWFSDHYIPQERRTEPNASPLLADDLGGFPPTYLATAGFDPLRDEGEEFAHRLADAGVPVVLRRHEDLIHGFANMGALGGRFAEAVSEAAGALRMGLAMARPAGPSGLDDPA